MRGKITLHAGVLAAFGLSLVLVTGALAQSNGSSQSSPAAQLPDASAQPAPGTTPVGGDQPAPAAQQA